MKREFLIGATVALFFSLLGCRNGSDRLQAGKEDETPLLSTYEMEVQLREHYEAVEQEIKQNYGIRDQKKVDQMMQVLIDDGALPLPYVFKRDAAGLDISYLSYVAYKDYRARTPIDTTRITTVYMDSLEKSLESIEKTLDSLDSLDNIDRIQTVDFDSLQISLDSLRTILEKP